MAARTDRFRIISRRLRVGTLGMFALLALAMLAGSRSRAQSAAPQQAPPAPGQSATQQSTPAPAQPAPDAQTTPAPAQQDAAAAPAQPAVAAAPTEPDPNMTPEEKRKQQVAQECADLLKLATDLKAQVDKARKDELSITVVRKATEVEQMAHKVRNVTTFESSNK
jgi:hypothetical protein